MLVGWRRPAHTVPFVYTRAIVVSAGSSLTARVHVVGLPTRAIRLEVARGPEAGKTVEVAERAQIGSAEGNDLTLTDPTVSRYHAELVRRSGRLFVADHHSTNGTKIDRVVLRGAEVEVEPGVLLGMGDSAVAVVEGSELQVELGSPSGYHGILGRSPAIRALTSRIDRVARRARAVLISGESGAGKELVARALHDSGSDRGGPFVTFDCGAIAPSLLIAELMGHERGAFTGAERARAGAFERAHGGTLFLDEIGELALEHQAALLGALERRRFRRVGGSVEQPFEARIVAATHRDLKAFVNSGRFRLDLFYRLAVVTLNVPPLRERLEDLATLVEHFLTDEGAPELFDQVLSPANLARFEQHDWPGNVRELRNAVLSLLATGELPALGETASPSAVAGASQVAPIERYRDARSRVVEAFEASYLARLLEQANGNVREAARSAQMDRSYLIQLLERHGMK